MPEGVYGVDFPSFRKPEIEQLRPSRSEENDRGLDVAVNDSEMVRSREGIGERRRMPKCLVERQRSTRQTGGKSFALQVLHYEELDVVLVADVVEDADVGMIQPRDRARFPLE